MFIKFGPPYVKRKMLKMRGRRFAGKSSHVSVLTSHMEVPVLAAPDSSFLHIQMFGGSGDGSGR